ncbi:hypothetical protein L873DRAFT_1800323, partial [Choiromyces venosus 120613-1]
MSVLFSDNVDSFNTNINLIVSDNRSEVLAWLSPLEPKLRHQDVQGCRVEHVGRWLLKTEEFKSWNNSSREQGCDKAVLFCFGNPGVGKTFISSLVVDTLCEQAREQNTAVACFYFEFAARKEQSATNMLGSLLKQVVSGMESPPEEVVQAFEEQKKVIGGRAPQLEEIVKMLQTVTSSRRTYICIDALDECAVAHRVKVLNSLNQIIEKSPATRLFVTGRPHIRTEIEKRLAAQVTSVSVCPRKDDIITYVRVRLDEDETPDAMDEGLEADILKTIPEKISEMFLLVSLNMDAILQESTTYRRRQRLSTMIHGSGLEEAYGATIERIKSQNGDKAKLGMAALMWICHAERPLRAGELCHALAVELGSTDFNAGNVPSIATLVNCCQGLITVDKEASTVRLIHFTLQEYLFAHPDLFPRPHATMAEVCLTYLTSRQVRALSANPSPNLQDTPFLQYCSIHWGTHARGDLSECAKLLALRLFEEYDSHISTQLLFKERGYWLGDEWGNDCLFTGLHCASFFGIVELAAALMEMESYNVNQQDLSKLTPLLLAARNGHEGVVKILLERQDVNPNIGDRWNNTPLSSAAKSGHEGVVKILLERQDVNPNTENFWNNTPLSLAAKSGHEGVVKILLERQDVN